MQTGSKIAVGLAGMLAVVVYFCAATYLERSYVDPRPAGRKVRILSPPFEHIGNYAVKYAVRLDPGTVVYEDREPLDALRDGDDYRGPGCFQILPNGITFSSTDGTDPNDGKHRYWLVLK